MTDLNATLVEGKSISEIASALCIPAWSVSSAIRDGAETYQDVYDFKIHYDGIVQRLRELNVAAQPRPKAAPMLTDPLGMSYNKKRKKKNKNKFGKKFFS